LRLAAGEKARTVDPRKQTGGRLQVADIGRASAIGALALVDDVGAQGVLDGLVDRARNLGQRRRVIGVLLLVLGDDFFGDLVRS